MNALLLPITLIFLSIMATNTNFSDANPMPMPFRTWRGDYSASEEDRMPRWQKEELLAKMLGMSTTPPPQNLEECYAKFGFYDCENRFECCHRFNARACSC